MRPINQNAVELTGPAAVQGTDEWLEYRRSHISATDIAPILGLSPYDCTATLWHSKKRPTFEKKDNPYIAAGHYFEDGIINYWVDKLGITDDERGKVYVDGWKMASLDGEGFLDGEHVGIEAKCVSNHNAWFDGEGNEIVPEYYVLQATWQMVVCGFRKVVFTVFSRTECEFLYRVVEYDGAVAAYIEEEAERFLNSLALDEMPDDMTISHPCKYLEQAKRNFQMEVERCTHNETSVELSNEMIDKVKSLKYLTEKIGKYNTECERLKTELAHALGENKYGTDKNGDRLIRLQKGRFGMGLRTY